MLWFLYIVFARHRQDAISSPYWNQCIYLLTDSLQTIPQYIEVPLNIEAKRIIYPFSLFSPINITYYY